MFVRTAVLMLLILTLSVATGSHLSAQTSGLPGAGDRLFQQTPDTPAGLVRGAHAAARLSQTQLARGFLQSLLDQAMSDEELIELRNQVGLSIFLSLNANVDLQPMAASLLKQVNRASSNARVTPEQAGDLVAQLGTSREATVEASRDLLSLGNSAAVALLTADIETRAGSLAYSLLRRHPRLFRYGILDALENAEPEQVQRGLRVLSVTADSELAPLLLEYEFAAESSAVRRAGSAAVDRLWSGVDRPKSADAAVNWLTEQAEMSLSEAGNRFADEGELALARAVRLAEIAVTIDPDDRVLPNAVLLACQAAATGGMAVEGDEPVRQAAADVAVHAGHSSAAAALIGSRADTLRRAMQMPGARVRVTAAASLLGLDGRVRGATLAQQMVRDASRGSTMPEAVVIDARLEQASEAVWLLGQQGYETDRCLTGQAGFEHAVRQLNCELILIHSNCLRWPLTQTVANLRADSRTAQTPIVVYGPRRVSPSVAQLQSQYPGVYRMSGPLSEINFADELRRSGVPGPMLTEEQRVRLIELAAGAL